MKKRKEVAALVLALMIFISMLYSLPFVSAVYTVEEHYMPPEPDDSEAICALKTRTDGYFYRPNLAIDLLKIEMLFTDSNITGDQAGGQDPWGPDGTVDGSDFYIVLQAWGSTEGQSGWDYMADIVPDRVIDGSDFYQIAINYGKSGTYSTDLTGVKVTFNTGEEKLPDSDGFVTIPQGATNFTVKRNSTPIGAMVIFYGPRELPIAYSTTFDFTVPAYTGADVGKEVWYYILTRLYVPSGLSGQNFYFVANADDSVQNVKMNGYSKTGSGSSVNIDLGKLGEGYHLLEFEFVDISGGGSLNFHVATGASQYAWLVRFRIYVPNYSDTKYEYPVTTTTWCSMKDDYFLIGYADDFIDDICVDGLVWQDWMWDMGPNYGAIYAWGDGFCYPLGNLENNTGLNAYSISFKFGEINATGLLDFQYISWTKQQDRIGRPKYCAKVDIVPASEYLIIYESSAWTGSEWISHPGRSLRTITTTVEFFVNITEDAKWWGLESNPQRVRVAMILDWLDPLCNVGSPMDIGVYFNITCLEGSWPISPYFDASTAVVLPQQDNMMRMPPSALIFNDQSDRSFISPGWAVDFAGGVAGGLTAYFIAKVLGYTVFGPAGAIIGIIAGESVKQLYKFSDNEQLASVKEVEGNETYRVFQKKRLVGQTSMCEAFFVRIIPVAATNCGSVKVECAAVLWLPFPMPESPVYYCYLPIAIGFSFAFPVFITD